MPKRKWRDWGEVRNHYVSKGWDPAMAAHMADQWEKRQEGEKGKEER